MSAHDSELNGVDDFRIRRMTKEDLAEVMAIENSCFQSPWSENAFTRELTENFLATYLVMEHLWEGGRCIFAYGGYWFIKSDIHITNIAVAPDYQGIGAGRMMMNALLEHARHQGAERVTLEVRQSNEPAKTLYRTMGFKILGVRPNYYQDNNEDAVIMYKVISDKGKAGDS